MVLPPSAAEALRELARPERGRSALVEGKMQAARAAGASLRSVLYPKQAAFFARGGASWRATRKARRAGITFGGVIELLGRAVEQPGFRATYMATTRDEAIARAWRSDTKSGFIDVLARCGKVIKHRTLTAYELGGIRIEVRETDLELNFSNGSQITLEGADKIKAYDRKRGGAKHVFWVDEAQGFIDLEVLFDAVVIPSLADFVGEAWFTGTPGRDCVGMFYDITKEPSDDEEPLTGWEVHELYPTDNPFFGRVVHAGTEWFVDDNTATRHGPYATAEIAEVAAREIRWEMTGGGALKKKGWTGDEPDHRREWLGKWVKEDARFVYPVHGIPAHRLLPQRLTDNPFRGSHPRFAGHPKWYDHNAAILDLPTAARGRAPHQWMYSIGVDFGYFPDPFALVVWAFCYDLPDIYEMFSWKMTRVHTDDQGLYMKTLWDQIPQVVSFVGDPANKQDDFKVWQERMNLPIEEANKRGKNTLEEFLADDIRRGRVHLRAGSPLHTEMKFLVYLPTKPGKTREVHKHRKVNGVVNGDHCCDSSRYSYADLAHFLSKAPKDKPPSGSREAYAAEEEREQRAIEDSETKRVRMMAEGDEVNANNQEFYQWQ